VAVVPACRGGSHLAGLLLRQARRAVPERGRPASIVALVVILGLSIALDYWWKRSRTSKAGPVQVAH
jgi:hypothetical protein